MNSKDFVKMKNSSPLILGLMNVVVRDAIKN